MKFIPLKLSGAYIIELNPFQDERGLFARTFCQREFEAISHTKSFVQINHSETSSKGIIRGMHFQIPPFGEVKLIRCVRGKIVDVLLDLRKDSPTFLQHEMVELSESNRRMVYIPEGFAHGFQSLSSDVIMIYHHTEYYAPEFERGLRYNDPRLNIQWPLAPTTISSRDQTHPLLTDNFQGLSLSEISRLPSYT
ncbi:MAG: dTDP-4-dehydrorhamnose 3,5-epimerase [Bacteroidota bacterium]